MYCICPANNSAADRSIKWRGVTLSPGLADKHAGTAHGTYSSWMTGTRRQGLVWTPSPLLAPHMTQISTGLFFDSSLAEFILGRCWAGLFAWNLFSASSSRHLDTNMLSHPMETQRINTQWEEKQQMVTDNFHKGWNDFHNAWNEICVYVCCCRGRFGQVHKCAELSSGLMLAAKIIKVRGMKERVSSINT